MKRNAVKYFSFVFKNEETIKIINAAKQAEPNNRVPKFFILVSLIILNKIDLLQSSKLKLVF